jgi:hypothetical protein
MSCCSVLGGFVEVSSLRSYCFEGTRRFLMRDDYAERPFHQQVRNFVWSLHVQLIGCYRCDILKFMIQIAPIRWNKVLGVS